MLPQAVGWLADDWSGAGPLDLSNVLVVVPTRQSGRRLREGLATYAATRGHAVFPPRVILPEALISDPENAVGVASRLESLLAWVDVFQSLPLDQFRRIFPVDPPAQSFSWALRLAEDFMRLTKTLAESGLMAVDVVRTVGEDFPELDRWEQIAGLERMYASRLERAGLKDSESARRALADAPRLESGIERIVVIGTPDPVPMALAALAVHAESVPVDVLIFADPVDADGFDSWGRPKPLIWAKRTIEIPELEKRVHLCVDPSAQADLIADLAQRYNAPEHLLGVGVADPEVGGVLSAALEEFGLSAFNPDGRPREGDAFHQLLASLASLSRDESFATVEALARCPDVLTYIQSRLGEPFSAARFLRSLDEVHACHLPPTLREARRHLAESRGLEVIMELRSMLTDGHFPENVVAALGAIFRERRLALIRPADAATASAIEVWMAILRDIRSAAKLTPVSEEDYWELALRCYAQEVNYDEKPTGALELQGWLELLWEDAPHLVVAGLNDGLVPEAIVGDPFLPEALRERMGLTTNAARFARDAYILQAIVASRRPDSRTHSAPHGDSRDDDGASTASGTSGNVATAGQIDLLLGKTSAVGDPLRPSRLLMRCADTELPARIALLFGAAPGGRMAPAWRRAWRLEPRQAPMPEKVAVTALRAWLACPFRFYLSRVLRMEAIDPEKTELDALDFGTLCHAALEAMGRAPGMRDATDPKIIRDFLLAALEFETRQRFGTELTLPLVVQLESARQRLSRAADIQAEARSAGWVIAAVEQPFELEIDGLVVSGKIDRIERHERDGALRVIDYKTSDQPVDPGQAHLRAARRGEIPADFACIDCNGKQQVWSDLQLPLYLRALDRQILADVRPPGTSSAASPRRAVGGYFNLPKAATATGIREWDEFTPELEEAAWRCARGVAHAIREGKFWPPNESLRAEQDPFAALFHHGVAASVTWGGTEVGASALTEKRLQGGVPGTEELP